MGAVEIIIIIAAAALVVFTLVFNIVRKRRGKSGCGCADTKNTGGCGGCSGCAYSSNCPSNEPDNTNTH